MINRTWTFNKRKLQSHNKKPRNLIIIIITSAGVGTIWKRSGIAVIKYGLFLLDIKSSFSEKTRSR